MRAPTILTVALFVFQAGCTPSTDTSDVSGDEPGRSEVDIQAILQFEQRVFDAQIAGDVDAWADSFVEDAIVMAPNVPALTSKQAIRRLYAPYFEQFNLHEETDEREIEVAGHWAYIRAHWTWILTPKGGGDAIEDAGNSIWILRRQLDDSWKIARVIYNSDKPIRTDNMKTFDPQEEAQALMELSREWSRVLATGDLEATLDFWADDATLFLPKVPMIEGKQAIREHIEAGADSPGPRFSWEPISAHISSSGDMAYLIERNVEETVGSDGKKVVTHNKVVTIWRKDSQGHWKNVVDIWNETPAPVK